MERMRHEAEESERIRKELQEKLRLMQEEQERTSRGEKCTCIDIGAHVLLLVYASNWGCLQEYFPFHGWVLKWYVFGRCLLDVTKEATVQTNKT